ncbi:MAG: bifunctional UDP-sugar hydrolase/5'-nucleotidase [Bacteroidales bacterium]
MKYFNLIVRSLILLIIINPVHCVFSQETGKLVILHTNDLHSRLDGYAPSTEYSPMLTGNDNTRGGFSRLATIIEKVKRENPGRTLVFDAGDFLMGTIFHYMEEYKPLQLSLMKEMGYDAVALGNHEFDYGPGRMADIISNSKAAADIPCLLLGNVDFDKKDRADDSFQDLFDKGVIKRHFILEKGGVKTGVFSLMGEDADEVAPFAAPLSFSKNTRAARKICRELMAEGCELIICLSHSGLEKGDDGQWTGEDVKLAEKVDDIDIIISAHTHTELMEPLIINNTLIVQTGSYGRNIGKLEIIMNENGCGVTDYSLIAVDDNMKGDADVQSKIDYQKDLISRKLHGITGYRLDDTIVSTKFELVCDEYDDPGESNLGPLVADAIYQYVNSGTGEGTDIAMVAAGVIRDRVVPGIQTTQDIFRIMSLGSGEDEVPGYPLARVYVNAKELKRVLEILLVAWKSTPSNYCYYSGLEVEYDPDKGLLRKIGSISIRNDNGVPVPVDLSRNNDTLYSIAANSYMLEFIGIIQKMTFGLIRVKPKDINGNEIADMSSAVIDFESTNPGVQEGKEWLALLNYLSSMKDVDNDGIPDLPLKYESPGLSLVPLQ